MYDEDRKPTDAGLFERYWGVYDEAGNRNTSCGLVNGLQRVSVWRPGRQDHIRSGNAAALVLRSLLLDPSS